MVVERERGDCGESGAAKDMECSKNGGKIEKKNKNNPKCQPPKKWIVYLY